MVQYQLVGSCVFACVKLCIYGQRMHLEYCQSCQSRLVHQGRCRTKQFTVEFVAAKQARSSSQQIATAELIIAKLPQYNTAWFTFLAFGTAKHVWSPHGTLPTRLQLLRLPFACITVHLIYGQHMHLEYDHNSHSHFENQSRQRTETYSWVGFVNSFKTKVNCKANAAVSKQSQYITTSACSCCNSFCKTHSWYIPAGWQLLFLFV